MAGGTGDVAFRTGKRGDGLGGEEAGEGLEPLGVGVGGRL